MKSNYRKIGDFIQLVDERNKELKVTKLLGLSISKQFIPSVANTIGTNMKNYKIIRKNQFACSTMQVRRDKKMPVALLQDFDEAIISQAYPVFEVVDETILNPEYLMMWFSRSEFDRHACFLAVGGVRGSLEWEDFLEMPIPVPSIEKQREIVKEYNTIVNRIKLNETLNQKLEDTAQALYKHWFVDFEFPITKESCPELVSGSPELEGKLYKSSGGKMVYNEELDAEIPLGWEAKPINYFSKIGSSKRVFQSEYKEKGIPFYRGKEISIKKSGKPIEDILYISEERYLELKEKYGKPIKGDILLTAVGTIGSSYLVEIEEFYFKDGNVIWFKNFKEDFYNNFIYAFMQSENFNEVIDNITIGSTQSAITMNALGNQVIIKPSEKVIKDFSELYGKIHKSISIKNKLNLELYSLKGLLLSKMSKVERDCQLVK
ncbi:restriction endonuclease subunit S [Algibacter pacificus]|uniref:restriction endonuclease subunit S n=1 Tax=Algibacter pacificus TaxID=2599389 RepID=UPI0011C7B5F4|nr:restriction endonuclease subunit S [Algibacter pacificus]